MRNTLTTFFTLAISLVGFNAGAQDSSAASTTAAAISYCTQMNAETNKAKWQEGGYASEAECIRQIAGTPKEITTADQYCRDQYDKVTEAKDEFEVACRGAGISGDCEKELKRCQSATTKEAGGLLGMLTGNDMTKQGFSTSCHQSTSEDQQDEYDKAQERMQEQLEQARADMAEAQDKLMQSQKDLLASQEEFAAMRNDAQKKIATLGISLPMTIRQENEESFAKVQDMIRQIDSQKLKRAAIVAKINSTNANKAAKLLELLDGCEAKLTDKKAQMRERIEKLQESTGGAAQMRSFNDIARYEQQKKNQLRAYYQKCMDQANKQRAILIQAVNAQIKELDAQILVADNEIARIEEAIMVEKASLEQRIAESKATADLEQKVLTQTVNDAFAALQAKSQTATQEQALAQSQMQDAQQRMSMGSNGMMGLGSQGGIAGALMGMFLQRGGGASTPAKGITHTVNEALAKMNTLKRYEEELSIKGCEKEAAKASRSSGSSSRGTLN